ncbi:MAG: ketoacyl-ACP synthase III [Candidatus Goldbacteria bacterium]|nr:ketoacyl-ACP synthase III [Candidatus Goldiibacteriota bacterium]
MNKRAAILGTGYYVPETIRTNKDIEKMLDTTDEWITSMTGIKERRLADKDQPTSFLAAKAAEKALVNAGIKKEEIDFVIVATVTGDYVWPSTANVVVNRLGINGVPSLDVSAACSGFIYGLSVARAYVESGMYKNILLIGAEEFAKISDWTDRKTCVLFGDGAGAVIVGQAETESQGILSTYLGSDGSKAQFLLQPGGGTANPFSQEVLDKKMQYVYMEGKEVFKHAVVKMTSSIEIAMEKANVTPEQVDYFIFHQANKRIIDSIAQRFEVPEQKLIVNIHKYANTSAATIPIALAEAVEEGKIKKGDLLGFSALGAGFTWGGAVVRL